MTYEGARSITGPYLATFGVSAAVVGFVAGFGELLGYALRIASGYFADTTGKYWAITIIGYVVNLLAVPSLALAGYWWVAAILMIVERVGKAIRVPSRDAMLSHAGHKIGMGWGFGLHEALDQIGAMLGPLIIASVLYLKGDYKQGFVILLIPALCALTVLFYARKIYPKPQSLEIEEDNFKARDMNLPFWLYLAAASLIAAGYADFSLMAYHFHKTAMLSPVWIPVFYSIAMGINMLTAPLLGWFYDRKGFSTLIAVSFFSCFFAPLVFWGRFELALIGVMIWSVGVSAHESLMRAIVAHMVLKTKRGTAYGIFNTGFGVFWFLGSFLMGILYDYSVLSLVIFSVTIQLMALPLLWIVMKKIR
ncbi:MFS transporter [Legionella jordanis]|nr:MFS transporter [Legionella jordanis]